MSKKEQKFSDQSQNKFEVAIAAIKTVLNDLNDIEKIVEASLFNTSIHKQVQQLRKKVASLASQADQGRLDLKEIQLATKSITALSQTIMRAKARNPLISDQLISLINKSVADANVALKLTQLALK